MGAKSRKREPGIICKAGKATTVILDIDHYRDRLELSETADDLIMPMELRQQPLKFRRFEDFLETVEYRRTIN
jgi:hypothetical protein